MTILGLNWMQYKETARHNLATEAETARSNRENEFVRAGTLTEAVRSNRASEGLKALSLDEQVRSNMANEVIARTNAATNWQNAKTNNRNALTNQGHLQISQQMQPYQQIESVTRSTSNIVNSVGKLVDAIIPF